MTASSRGTRAAASLIRTSHRRPIPTCKECKTSLRQQRPYAVTATDSSSETSPPSIQDLNTLPPHTSTTTPPIYKTYTGIILSRPPLLTPTQSPFEKAFFFYQKRLNERLVLPFTRYFYHKKDTPADADWKVKAAERNWAPAKELGGYNPYDRDEGWNDELLVREVEEGGLMRDEYVRDVLVEDGKVRAVEGREGEVLVEEEGEGEKDLDVVLAGRETDADRAKDVKRLDRELTRTLYLVVKRVGSGWGFPSGEVVGRENLHQAAERILIQSAGINMNTWLVGRVPIGHHILQPYTSPDDASKSTPGLKTFFLKARIMAGQADLKGNLFGLEDYKWLTREELAGVLRPRYWSRVKGALHDR